MAIVERFPAPWAAPDDLAALTAEAKRMLKTEVTFAPGSVVSKFKPFSCKSKVRYEANSIEADALFQGNLPEPNPTAAAARLGFPKGDIPGVDVRCLKGMQGLKTSKCRGHRPNDRSHAEIGVSPTNKT